VDWSGVRAIARETCRQKSVKSVNSKAWQVISESALYSADDEQDISRPTSGSGQH